MNPQKSKWFKSVGATGALVVLAAMLLAFKGPDTAEFPALKDAVVLVIRHAEKPTNGFELNEAGQKRAAAYPAYFKNLKVNGQPVKLDHIFATADSANSHRPRLTVEPLGKALDLEVDHRIANKKFEDLVMELRTKDHGKTILICWHHGEIPSLVQALGADPAKLLPEGKWPEQTFDWMLELHYGHDGRLSEARRVPEKLMPGDKE